MIRKSLISATIKVLRAEATEVKKCFTDFSFKAGLLAAAFFGLSFTFQLTEVSNVYLYFMFWLFCAGVYSVLMGISRIGYHKYSTANRNYGYELHINRTYDYEYLGIKREDSIRKIGWEEAMCAWRIVQPVLFEEIYKVKKGLFFSIFPMPLRERVFVGQHYHWWNTKHLLSEHNYKLPFHPGRYLRNMQSLIHFLCLIVFVIFSLTYYKGYDLLLSRINEKMLISETLFLTIILAIYVVLFLFVSSRIFKHRSRTRVLENGLLSIQSCAVVWRLVVLAHLKAVSEGKKPYNTNSDDDRMDYQGYTFRVARNALQIKKELFNIHKTIMKDIWPGDNVSPLKKKQKFKKK